MQLPIEVKAAHEELIAKREVNHILRSKAVRGNHIEIRDALNAFIKQENQKRGTRSLQKSVLHVQTTFSTVTVPGS